MQLENQFGTGCGGIIGSLTVEMPTFDRPVMITDHVDANLAAQAARERDKHKSIGATMRLPPFMSREPTFRLTAEHKRWVWEHRNSATVKQCPQARPHTSSRFAQRKRSPPSLHERWKRSSCF